MANDLHTLIRIRKWEVDQKQREIAKLFELEGRVLQSLQDLADEIERERALMSQLELAEQVTFAGYLKRCDQRRDRLNASLHNIRLEIENVRAQLRDAYRRLKTLELGQEKRDLEEAAELALKESQDLDEVGLNLHRRREAEASF